MNKTSALEKLISGAALASERTIQWVSIAIERQLQTENFIVANQTPFDVIHRKGLLSVRRYPPLAEDHITAGGETLQVRRQQHGVPILLVPPLAADPLNFDLFPSRSLVRFLLAHGYRVYLADFGSPEQQHSHLGLVDYTTRMLPEALAKVREDAGVEDVSLFGYCMGGLFCLIYAGWSHDPHIRNIVTIASPIDSFQAGIAGKLWQAMQVPARLVRRYTDFRIHNLDPSQMNVPGWLASLSFKMTNPLGTLQGYFDLLLNLWDREYVTEYQTMATWFNKMHDYPGGIVQDIVVRVGIDNALSKGKISMGHAEDREALLEKIDCSLLAIAGKTDKIVTIDAAKKVMDIVGSTDKTFALAPGGHAGVFAGSKAPATSWRIAADWLATRSDYAAAAKRGAARAPARKRASSRTKRAGASKGTT